MLFWDKNGFRKRRGGVVKIAQNVETALNCLDTSRYGFVIAEPYHSCVEKIPERMALIQSFLEKATAKSPTMLLTSLNEEWLADYGLEKGAHYHHYMQKPTPSEKIISRIGQILSGQ